MNQHLNMNFKHHEYNESLFFPSEFASEEINKQIFLTTNKADDFILSKNGYTINNAEYSAIVNPTTGTTMKTYKTIGDFISGYTRNFNKICIVEHLYDRESKTIDLSVPVSNVVYMFNKNLSAFENALMLKFYAASMPIYIDEITFNEIAYYFSKRASIFSFENGYDIINTEKPELLDISDVYLNVLQ